MTGNERYVFSDTELAEARLRLLAEVFEPTTRRFIQDVVRAPVDLVLDLGCGPGNTTRLLADAIKASRVIGLDASDAFITRSRGRETEHVSFGVHDATVTPFPCGPADVIFARYLLTHLGDPFPIVRKWSTQLNVGGFLLLEETDAIESSNTAVTDYIDIVQKMMAAQGDDLFVGNRLARMDDSIGTKLLFNRNMDFRIPLHRAATLFGANIKVWRDREYVKHNYSQKEIDILQDRLLSLAADPSTDEQVQWTMRQVAFKNA